MTEQARFHHARIVEDHERAFGDEGREVACGALHEAGFTLEYEEARAVSFVGGLGGDQLVGQGVVEQARAHRSRISLWTRSSRGVGSFCARE